MTASGISVGCRIPPGADAAVRDFGVRFAAVNVRIMAPNLFARCGIRCDDNDTSSWQVEPALNQYRVGLKCKRFTVTLSEFTGTVALYLLERSHIVARYLRQAGVLHAMLATTVVVPPRRITGLSDGGYRSCDHHCDQQVNEVSINRWFVHKYCVVTLLSSAILCRY